MTTPPAGATPIDAIHARLLALHPKRIDLSLGRIERLLAALGHPEQRLPPLIHVAGTNGKGSTIAFMRAILEAAQQRVHVYTSPNLVRLNERFRLAQAGGGKFVGDEELADVLTECEVKNRDAPITVFEMETAAAFLLFSRHPADILLLEVGLGGRLDATNVVEKPIASVITRLSLDHRDFLGETLACNRRREGRHSETRRAGGGNEPGARRARGHRAAGRACQSAARHCRRGLDGNRGARTSGVSGRRWAARFAGA